MFKFLKNITVIIFLGLVSQLNAQYHFFENIDNEKGLPQSQVYDILQDRNGFMWIATGGGLALYDGHEVIKIPFSVGLRNVPVYSIYQGKTGTLFLGTEYGLGYLRNDSVYVFPPEKDKLPESINDIYQDTDDLIWVAGERSIKVYKFANNKFVLQKAYENTPSLKIIEFRGLLYFLLSDGGLISSYNNTLEAINRTRKSYINDIFSDGNYIWFTDEYGLQRFDGKHAVQMLDIKKVDSYYITGITQTLDGSMWIGTTRGDFYRLTAEGLLKKYKYAPFSTWGYVNRMVTDSEDNIYIGTDGAGLVKYNHSPIINFNDIYSLGYNSVWKIIEYKDKILFGTDGFGIKYYDGDNVKKLNTAVKIPKHIAQIGASKKHDMFWIAKYGGIELYNYDLTRRKELPATDNSYFVNDIDVMDNGDTWITTMTMGMLKYSNGKYTLYDSTGTERPRYFYSLIKTEQGKMYLSSSGGLVEFSGEDYIIYDMSKGYTNPDVFSVATDNKGTLFVGTSSNGIKVIKEKNLKAGKFEYEISVKDGLSNNEILSLNYHNDTLWCGNNKGVDRIVFSENGYTIQNYGKSEGFLGVECNSNAILNDSEGRIWFGTVKGVSMIDSELDFVPVKAPKAYITNISISDDSTLGGLHSLFNGEELVLPYEHNSVKFNFTALFYKSPESIKYTHFLSGLNRDWSKPNSIRQASYTNLSPGKYEFKVAAITSDGTRSSNNAIVYITILKPYWLKTWFIVLVVASVLLLIYLTIKFRIAGIENKKSELEKEVQKRTKELSESLASKDKLFSIISHDLKGPFLPLLGSAKLLNDEISNLSKSDIKELTGSIENSLTNLYQLVEKLLEWSRINLGKINYQPERLNAAELINNVISNVNLIAEQKRIKINVTCSENIYIFADSVMINSVIHNLLVNAVKFSFANTTIDVIVNEKGKNIQFEVIDHGRGMNDKELNSLFDISTHFSKSGTNNEKGSGLGLLIVAEMIQKNNGEMSVKSREGEGSNFSFYLPKANA